MSSGQADAPAAPAMTIDIAPLIAPVLYGILISWGLLGLLVHQAHVYFSRFAEKDPAFFKVIVYSVLFAEFLFSAMVTHLAHSLLISGWGNPLSLNKLPWSAVALPLGSSLMAAVVQLFFAWRIWMLNRESVVIRGVTCLIPLITLLHLGCSLTVTVTWVTEHNLELFASRHAAKHVALTSTALVASFSADVFITALMVISLLNVRQQSKAVRSTVAMINHLIIRSIETGAVTTIVAMLELIFYIHPKMKTVTYFVIPAIPIGRFYSTMFMANLNGRGYFSGAKESSGVHSVNTDFELKSNTVTSSKNRRFENGIMVTSTAGEESYVGKGYKGQAY